MYPHHLGIQVLHNNCLLGSQMLNIRKRMLEVGRMTWVLCVTWHLTVPKRMQARHSFNTIWLWGYEWMTTKMLGMGLRIAQLVLNSTSQLVYFQVFFTQALVIKPSVHRKIAQGQYMELIHSAEPDLQLFNFSPSMLTEMNSWPLTDLTPVIHNMTTGNLVLSSQLPQLAGWQ